MTVMTQCRARRRVLRIAVGVSLLALLPTSMPHIAAQTPPLPTYKLGDLVITSASVRQPPKGARVAGGYMKITNTGKDPDRLIGGGAAFAKRFEVHEMAMEGGVMKMRELPTGLEIRPGATIELKPGGYHLMFMDLTEAPTPGKPTKIKLRFEKAGEIELDMTVTPASGADTGHKHH